MIVDRLEPRKDVMIELPPAPLEFLFSTNAAKALHVKTTALCSTNAGNFLQQWRIELMDDLIATKAFLITNVATLFTFLIPQEPRCSLNSVRDTFLMRLRFSLLAGSPPIEWRPSQIVPVRGNPRSVIGTMNDMIAMITFRRGAENFRRTEAEEFLNDTPFSMIGMDSPKDRFLRELQRLIGKV